MIAATIPNQVVLRHVVDTHRPDFKVKEPNFSAPHDMALSISSIWYCFNEDWEICSKDSEDMVEEVDQWLSLLFAIAIAHRMAEFMG